MNDYMEDAWSVMSLDQCINGVYDSKEAAELVIANTILSFGLEAVPIKVNRTPEDERTLELKKELEEAWMECGVRRIHLSKGIKFYESSVNERYQLLIDMVKGQGVFDPKNKREIDLMDNFAQQDAKDFAERKSKYG